MVMIEPTLDDARTLLEAHIDSLALRNHCKAVAATMAFIARSKGEDEQKWAAIGMVHDLDWEKYPAEHCARTKQFLEAAEWPPEYVRAVLAHGWQICTDVEPLTELEKNLYAIDELTGFVTACALVRPSKSVRDLEVKSVRKKWKSAAFAAGVDRDVIIRGTAMLGVELDELIQTVIDAMREVADDIGL
jgi:predicted hydrolase (HD superfamily)